MSEPHDLIFVSLENWDAIWRRNQFVCAELCRRHRDLRILFVGLPRNLSHAASRGRVGEFFRKTTYAAPGFEQVTVTHPPKLLPNSILGARRVNEFLFRRHVAREAARLGFRVPVLWINPHYAAHLVGRLGEAAAIYDITDDWTTLTQSADESALIARQDAELCGKADATIVCSQRLFEMKRALARELHLVPNGVDAAHYARVLDPATVRPAESARWRRPVLGYTGTVHPDRVDVGLVAALAKAHDGSVVLIGPNHLTAADLASLSGLGNVFVHGPVPYAEIPDYMAAFDVCITPHKMTPFTESLNPIKLWEYLAAGLPIVSTDVAGFRDYPELVRVARTPDEFIAATHAALAEDSAKSELRRAEAARHSWTRRVDDIEAVIASCLERRASLAAAAPAGPRQGVAHVV